MYALIVVCISDFPVICIVQLKIFTKAYLYLYHLFCFVCFHPFSVMDVSFTSDNYRASESGGTMTVVAKKNKRIASPLSLVITPMNVSQAMMSASGLSLPRIPADDKPRSPNRAKSKTL